MTAEPRDDELPEVPLTIEPLPRYDGANGAAFFDVDRTLMAGAAALRMARPFRRHGLLSQRQQLRAALMQASFMLRGMDDQGIERFAAIVKPIVVGWEQEEVRRVIEQELERHVHPTVFREALERVDLHHRQGQPVFAVSATMGDIVEPLARLLGLDGGVGSQMEVVDGRFTGNIAIACHGEGKAQRLRELAELHGIDLSRSSAYSDSISDQHFLRAVGRPYAVNPDRELRKLAEVEGWGILHFRTRVKVPLHRRRAAHASVAVAAAAVMAGLLRQRRRSQRR